MPVVPQPHRHSQTDFDSNKIIWPVVSVRYSRVGALFCPRLQLIWHRYSLWIIILEFNENHKRNNKIFLNFHFLFFFPIKMIVALKIVLAISKYLLIPFVNVRMLPLKNLLPNSCTLINIFKEMKLSTNTNIQSSYKHSISHSLSFKYFVQQFLKRN